MFHSILPATPTLYLDFLKIVYVYQKTVIHVSKTLDFLEGGFLEGGRLLIINVSTWKKNMEKAIMLIVIPTPRMQGVAALRHVRIE